MPDFNGPDVDHPYQYYQPQSNLPNSVSNYPSPEATPLKLTNFDGGPGLTPPANPGTLASPSRNAGAGTGKASLPREGTKGPRKDKEPRVYGELDSYPKFNEQVPPDATLQELCMKYPNHLRGQHLDAFIQWCWSANDIYNHLAEKALRAV